MTHESIKNECEALKLTVRQVPTYARGRAFEAVSDGICVYWSTSYELGLLGLPRVVKGGVDTHARNLKEIRYLVQVPRD